MNTPHKENIRVEPISGLIIEFLLFKIVVTVIKQYFPIEPIEVMNAKKDWIQDDKNLIETFKNDYEITNSDEDFVSSKNIENWINDRKLGITMKKFGMEMKRYTTVHKLDKVLTDIKFIGKSTRGWVGIKERVEENE